MDPVVHFELPYEDRDRMVGFYSQVFGWTANKLGPEMGNYVVVMTGEDDPVTKRPKEPGRINGGLYQKNETANVPTVTISVEDIHAAMKRVEESGGRVIGGSKGKDQPDDIPGVGLYISIIDSEGNRLSLLQPAMPKLSE
jgi:predicted enzyme related to lactoylglutathione lyase